MVLEYNLQKPFLDLCRMHKDFLMHHNRTQRQHVANFGNHLTHDTAGDENVVHFQIQI